MSFFHRSARRWVITALAVTFSLSLGGCDTQVSPKRALSNCIAKKVKSMQKGARGELSDFSDDLHHRIAEQDCQEIFTPCDTDPEGRACTRLTSRFSKTVKKLPNQR